MLAGKAAEWTEDVLPDSSWVPGNVDFGSEGMDFKGYNKRSRS